MSSKNETPDLKLLCSQIFSGVGYMHGKEIIASRRKLLFQEAVKVLYSAGIEGEELDAEMSSLEELIKNYLSEDKNKATQEFRTEPSRTQTDFIYEDGSHYVGQILDGEPDGKGTLNWPDGSAYSGTFKKSEIHGTGKHKSSEGDEYVGEFVNGDRHGRGTLIRSDGSSYSGGWSQGEFDAFGKHIECDGSTIEGEHVDGKLNGYATENLADGSSYKGEWKDSKRHGQGILTEKDGKTYSGRFVDGLYAPPKPVKEPRQTAKLRRDETQVKHTQPTKRSLFTKAKRALIFAGLVFCGVTAYQAWAQGIGFLSLLDTRLVEISKFVGLEESTEEVNPDPVAVKTGASASLAQQFQMGLEAFDRRDYAIALDTWRPLAEQGHADAQAKLALMYSLGRGVTKDYIEAAKWQRKAAEQGAASAQYSLALMYEYGRGIAKDKTEAVNWYRKAVAQDHVRAHYNLAVLYAQGQGVTKDNKKAGDLFRKAATQGDSSSQAILGGMYKNGEGVSKDYKKAVYWYRKAVEQENALAQFRLGQMFAAGNGVVQDDKEAANLYRKAAEQKFGTAQFHLASNYHEGRGLPQDNVYAHMWYEIAASNRVIEAVTQAYLVQEELSEADLARAQELKRECVNKKYKGC